MAAVIPKDVARECECYYNHNLTLVKMMEDMMPQMADRQKIQRWLKKLKYSKNSEEELRLRNDFMYYLVLQIQARKLAPPFDMEPPAAPLEFIAHLLPGEMDQSTDAADDQSWLTTAVQCPGFETTKPTLFSQSPDGGAFLEKQPRPVNGGYCYIAVVSKTED